MKIHVQLTTALRRTALIASFGLASVVCAEAKQDTLTADKNSVSLGIGGTQTLTLAPGLGYIGGLYLLLGTASGTMPGVDVNGLHLPLNVDAYTLFTLGNPNTPPLANSVGIVGVGPSTAAVTIPPLTDPALAGVELHHAYIVLDLPSNVVVHASNAVSLLLTVPGAFVETFDDGELLSNPTWQTLQGGYTVLNGAAKAATEVYSELSSPHQFAAIAMAFEQTVVAGSLGDEFTLAVTDSPSLMQLSQDRGYSLRADGFGTKLRLYRLTGTGTMSVPGEVLLMEADVQLSVGVPYEIGASGSCVGS